MGRPAEVPLSGRFRHRLFRDEALVAPQPSPDGRWRVRLVLAAHGRFPLRLVAAVGLRLFRSRIDRELGTALGRAAARWDAVVPALTALHGEALRRRVLEDPAPKPAPNPEPKPWAAS
ncbi:MULTISPECIES: hypothetical protein [unclassified Streptomyces]|uniref:hypothetical protein n=1 Tax=unclassified Streptomyces TaxID=2593676 RepID=UPI0006F272F3|nr:MULTISPECIES: hypothetical protein [unclassified Streptomyces]KQX59297.1 hypothetical protein ASD33_03115 [Streptomyces sp. Root1304]KRB00559.1 hypothetical protein ASE09_03115 [Streptomyces sp. Root66D1]